jgi:beta-lactamase regulating signal transducer with metallopeptidase domain/protein involved in polysaccharide export with SLBB domain
MLLFVLATIATYAVLGSEHSQPPAHAPVVHMTLTPVAMVIGSPAPVSRLVHSKPSASVIDPMQWAGLAWLLGASGTTLWHFLGWLWIQRCVRRGQIDTQPMLETLTASLGIRRTIRLVESAGLNVPAVVGVFRPVILIPLGFLNDLAPDQVEAILIHELAHIRRHDYLVNLLQIVVESLLFYHPATWWISSRIRIEREHCCDDIAASRYTPRSYVSALLALEQRRTPMTNALVAATGGTLLERVQRLMGRGSLKKRSPMRSALAALLAIACICMPIAIEGCKKTSSTALPTTVTSNAGDDQKSSGITEDDLKPDYSVVRIGCGDLVEVSVNDLMGLGVQTTKRVRVSDPGGTISVPIIPKEIKIAGMTDLEAQLAIAKAYKDGQIIYNAQVAVTRIEATSTKYTVLGSGVGKPGEYANIDPNLHLTAALAGAEVHLEGQKSILIARKDGDSTTRILRISAGELMAGDPHLNVVMRPGDVVMLPTLDRLPTTVPSEAPAASAPDRGQFWVGGVSIKQVGVYAYPAGGITLKQAIISAGGIDGGYICVFRRSGASESLALRNAEYSKLLSGAVTDIELHPGDTVVVNPTPQQWLGATTQQGVAQ